MDADSKARVKGKVVRLVSAGGVVYKKEGEQVSIVLCGNTQPVRWSLPKGTPNKGESLEETALREVREETGLEVAIVQRIGEIDYWFVRPSDKARCFKTVHFYLMTPLGGSIERHDPEFEKVQWFPANEALEVITYENEAKIIRQALSLIPSGCKV